MGETYEYYECNVEIGRHGASFEATRYGPDVWDGGVEYARLEIEGSAEDLPWMHAKEVDVRAPWESSDGEVTAVLEFSAEPATTAQRLSTLGERIVELRVESTEFEITKLE